MIGRLARSLRSPAAVAGALLIGVTGGVASWTTLTVVRLSGDHTGVRQASEVSSSPGWTLADFLTIRDAIHSATVSAYGRLGLFPRIGDEVVPLTGYFVEPDFFKVVQVRLATGRTLTESLLSEDVAVLSYGAWKRRFGGDPSVIGRMLEVNSIPTTIVAVLEPDFTGLSFGDPPEIYLPAHLALSMAALSKDFLAHGHWLTIVGRVNTGTTRIGFENEFRVAAAAVHRRFPVDRRALVPISEACTSPELEQRTRRVAGVLAGLTLILVGAAWANLVTFALIRSESRRREYGVRVAFGATRPRLLRLLLVEESPTVVWGAVCGCLVWQWLASGARPFRFAELVPMAATVFFSWGGVIFTTAYALGSGVVAVFCRFVSMKGVERHLAQDLRESPRALFWRYPLVRMALLGIQVGVCIAVSAQALLTTQSLVAQENAGVGFDIDRTVLIQPRMPIDRYSAAEVRELQADLLKTLRDVRGVKAVALAVQAPLRGGSLVTDVVVPGGTSRTFKFNEVTDGYFEALGVRMIDGQTLNSRSPEFEVVVNQALAGLAWPTSRAVGRTLDLSDGERRVAKVVGVVTNAKYEDITEDFQPTLYAAYGRVAQPNAALIVRAAGAVDTVLPAVRALVKRVLPGVTAEILPFSSLREHALSAAIALTNAVVCVAGIGWALSLLGVWSTVSYLTSVKRRELAIRIALGASPSRAAAQITREAAAVSLGGALSGWLLFRITEGVSKHLLYGVDSSRAVFDLMIAVAAAVSLIMIASWIAVVRHARIQPSTVLRTP